MTEIQRVVVLGAGNFGTCLAQHLATLGHAVAMWSRRSELADSINREHRNPRYLTEIALMPTLVGFHELERFNFAATQAVVLAVPTQSLRSVLSALKGRLHPGQLMVSTAKGIETETNLLPSQIVAAVLGPDYASQLVILSGPSFAIEVARHMPTAVAAASCDAERARFCQRLFHAPFFRVYTNEDPIGVELAGAMKNVIALAAGACAGFGFQANSRAAVITRGLAEITRMGLALGARPLTFNGLAGVGDLFLTCSSEQSRNYRVGYLLGRGETLEAALQQIGSVAEGVYTARSAWQLAAQLGVSAPITQAVYQVLYEARPVQSALQELLTRNAGTESF